MMRKTYGRPDARRIDINRNVSGQPRHLLPGLEARAGLLPDGGGLVAPKDEVRSALNLVAVVAIVDALLLVPLLIAALQHAEGTVDILGPLHGIGFLILVGLVIRGTLRKYWGWWFPAITVVTGGPPGCLVGDLLIRRQLDAEA